MANRYDKLETDQSIELVHCSYCNGVVPISACTQQGSPMKLRCDLCDEEAEAWFDYLNPSDMEDEDLR